MFFYVCGALLIIRREETAGEWQSDHVVPQKIYFVSKNVNIQTVEEL